MNRDFTTQIRSRLLYEWYYYQKDAVGMTGWNAISTFKCTASTRGRLTPVNYPLDAPLPEYTVYRGVTWYGRRLPAHFWRPSAPTPLIRFSDVCCSTHTEHLRRSVFCCCRTTGLEFLAGRTFPFLSLMFLFCSTAGFVYMMCYTKPVLSRLSNALKNQVFTRMLYKNTY